MGKEMSKLGELLVRDKIITQTQLNHALQVQKEHVDRRRLGEVLMDLGYINRKQLRSAIQRHGKRMLFGELLVENGMITREQLDAALQEKRASGLPLGTILLMRGAITEEALAQALSQQLDYPYLAVQPRMVDMKLFNLLPEKFIKANSVLPVCKVEGVVTIVAADPTDQDLLYRLEDTFGKNMELAICAKSRIDQTIEALLQEQKIGAAAKRAEALDQKGLTLGDQMIFKGDRIVGETEEIRRAAGILDYIIYNAVEERASDVHIEPTSDRVRVRCRIDGTLVSRTELPITLARSLTMRAKALAKLDVTGAPHQQIGRIVAKVKDEDVDLRVTISRTIFGEALSIRIFSRDTSLFNLEELGMWPATLAALRNFARRSAGAYLFVGPTGSGKTTSQYATLCYLNDGTSKIISVEAPVECAINGITQHDLPANDYKAIIEAFWGILYEDPDVLALGEASTNELAEAVLKAALVGRKILTTFHAEDSAAALVRLGELPEAGSLMASSSVVVVAQRLVRKVCPRCAVTYIPPRAVMEAFRIRDVDPALVHFKRGMGCQDCLNTGFLGRTGVFELLPVEEEIRKVLQKKPSAHEIRDIAKTLPNFLSLKQAAFLKAARGITPLEEAFRVLPALEAESREAQRCSLSDLLQKAGLTEMAPGRD